MIDKPSQTSVSLSEKIPKTFRIKDKQQLFGTLQTNLFLSALVSLAAVRLRSPGVYENVVFFPPSPDRLAAHLRQRT